MAVPFTQHLCAALIGVCMLSSCSRPTAYFQRTPVEDFAKPQAIVVTTPTQPIAPPTEEFSKVNTALTQIDAYVRNDSKLATDKKLVKRMERVKSLLVASHGALQPTSATTPHRINLMERLMLKKINKQINQQSSPSHAEKTPANGVRLVGGIVLLIVGLLLLILGTGTTAFIGLIVGLIGALAVILGLFGE